MLYCNYANYPSQVISWRVFHIPLSFRFLSYDLYIILYIYIITIVMFQAGETAPLTPSLTHYFLPTPRWTGMSLREMLDL